ncbi:MAG: serine--tRNA ligase [Cyclobacteriaceae bacterium]|nr:serine--tRNA ligase [Cyclobacteriaceae bacterium]
MLQLTQIRENKEKVIEGLNKRSIKDAESWVDKIITLDDTRKSTQTQLDGTLAESNKISKEIGQLMREGKKEEADKVKQKTTDLKASAKELSEQLSQIESELETLLYQAPNIPHESVVHGNSDEDNIEIEREGVAPTLKGNPLPHWDLIKKYDIIDFELGTKITGAGFPVYKGKGARLVRAMINFFLDEAEKAGYHEVQPPILVNKESGMGTGQLPDKDGQMYHMPEDDLYVIPTAEVPITNMYRDMILNADQLPIKNVGYTPCFRREAGSWGAHVRGLNRLHQFDKVEIVQIAHPDESYKLLEEMIDHVSSLLRKLELPFRKLRLCGGDLGFAAALTIDFEVYSAAQKKWLEVSSVSNFETFQANRLKLRIKEDKNSVLLHTLNGSALAIPRVLASILENNQTEEGIKIPEVLVPYTGFDWIK